VVTKEGARAFTEAIEFLMKQKPRKPFLWSDDLAKAANDHLIDVAPKGVTSGVGTNGSQPCDRIQKYGQIDEAWAESSLYGVLNSKEVIERLIVCDGQPRRGFRHSVFSDDLKLCGIATSEHSTHENMV